MACNCKRGLEIQDKYGVKQEESVSEKIYRYGWKVLVAILFLVLSIVAVPIMIGMVMYNIVFGKGKPIVLPKPLSKYLK